MALRTSILSKLYIYAAVNLHVLWTIFGYKNREEHRIVLATSPVGDIISINCTCGEHFWETDNTYG